MSACQSLFKRVTASFLLLGAFAFAGAAFSETATTSLTVTANVSSSCTIQSISDLAFGSYDPTNPSHTETQGNIVFRCVKGTSYKVYIVGTRSMSGGSQTLDFQLYTDPGRAITFPNDNSGSSATATDLNPVAVAIYGRIPARQDVGAATYSVVLNATVEY